MRFEVFDDRAPETVVEVGGRERKMEQETGMNDRMIGSKKTSARFPINLDVSSGLLEVVLLAYAVIDSDSVITEGRSTDRPSEACLRCA